MAEENTGLSQSLIDSLLSGEKVTADSAEKLPSDAPDSNAPDEASAQAPNEAEGVPFDAMPTEVTEDAFVSAAPAVNVMPTEVTEDAFASAAPPVDAMPTEVTEDAFASAIPMETPVSPDTFVPVTPPETEPDDLAASAMRTPPPGVVPGVYTPDTLPEIPSSVPDVPGPPVNTPAPQPSAGFQENPAPVQGIEHLERAIAESNSLLMQKSQEIHVLQQQLNTLTQKFEEITADLQGTPAYKAKNTFTCPSCEAQGLIAAPIKCTKCDKTHWWGWWPDDEEGEDEEE